MRAILDCMKLTAAALTIALVAPLTVAEAYAADIPNDFRSYLVEQGYSAEDINAVEDYLDTNAGQNYAKQLAANPNDEKLWSTITVFVQPGAGTATDNAPAGNFDFLEFFKGIANPDTWEEAKNETDAGMKTLDVLSGLVGAIGEAGVNDMFKDTEAGDYLIGLGYQASDFGPIAKAIVTDPTLLDRLLNLVSAGEGEVDPREALTLIDELFTAAPPSAKPDPNSQVFVKIKEAMADYMGLITTGVGYTDAQVTEILAKYLTPSGVKKIIAMLDDVEAGNLSSVIQTFSSENPPENLGAFAITGIVVGILAILGLGFAAVQQFAPELLPF